MSSDRVGVMRCRVMSVLAVAAIAVLSSCTRYDDSPVIRSDDTLDRFSAISVALAEGYVVDTSSDYYVPEKGIELTNPAYVELDPLKPQSVLYEFNQAQCDSSEYLDCPDGGFRYIGVRYSVRAEVGSPPPMLQGEVFDGPVGDPPVYQLFTWFNDNPNGLHASTNPAVQPPAWWPGLYSTWKSLNDRFPTPDDALAAGYIEILFQLPNGIYTDCVPWPGGHGGMGYHYVQLNRITYDPASIDPIDPQGLVYEKKADGTFILGAVEWFLWTMSNHPPPTLDGFQFDGPMPAHGPGQAEHYDLHGYVGYLNPDGVWTKWNREVGCPYSK